MDATTYRDVAVAPLWAGANLLLAVAAWKLARRFFPEDGEDQMVVHAIVAAWACVTGLAMVLGTTGALTGLGLVAAVAIAAAAVLYRVRPGDGDAGAGTSAGGEVGLVCKIFGYIFFTYFICFVLMHGLGSFPSDWDTLMYHLSRIDQWIQSASLHVSDCYNWSHPGNNELIGLWTVAPFSGDFLIALNNLPSAGLLGFASISLGRGLGLSHGLSYLTAAAIVSNAVVFRQLLDAKNDIAVAGLFVACLSYGIRAGRAGRMADLVWGGLGIGLLGGTKYNAIGYVGLGLATIAPLIAAARGIRVAFKLVAVWSSCLIAWGGFWYIRNALMVGSPLYPVGFTPESNVLPLVYPELRRSSLWGCGRPEVLPLALDATWRMAGPAHVVAVLVVPAAAIWLTLSGFGLRDGRRWNLEAWTRRALVFWIFGSAAVLLVTPFSAEDTPDTLNHLREGYTPVRFGLCFLSLSLLAASVLIQDLSRGLRRLVIRLAARFDRHDPTDIEQGSSILSRWAIRLIPPIPYVAWGVVAAAQFVIQARRSDDDLLFHLLVAIVLVEVAWILGLGCALYPRARGWITSALILSAGLGIAGSCGRLSSSWHSDYARYYDNFFGTEVFTGLAASERRSTRLCVLYYRAYPYHGSKRQYRVFQPMWVPSRPWLIDYLKANGIEEIILYKNQPSYPGWMNYDAVTVSGFSHDRSFQTFFEDASFVILGASPTPTRPRADTNTTP